MNGEKARMIFTDPPYNVDYHSTAGNTYSSAKYGGEGNAIFNDNKTEVDAIAFYSAVLRNAKAFSTDDAVIYWWYASRNYHLNHAAFREVGWKLSQVIIWLKNSIIFSYGQEYHRCYEPCIVGWKEGKSHFTTKMFNNLAEVFSLERDALQDQIDVWYEHRDPTSEYVHPTQKPVRLIERGLRKSSRAGELVIDFFGGSGSTLMGCEQLGRRCFSVELDPKFCDVIVQRYVNLTKSRNIRLNGAEIEWADILK